MRVLVPWIAAALLAARFPALAADPVFSGPQPGEKATPFRVVEITGADAGKERDPMTESAGAPTVLVFIHGLERSMVPLLRVVDEYGAMRKDSLRSEAIFLSADRLQGEQRAKAAAGSLRLQSRVGLSLDGAEGPGNYGLNRDCLMTIIAAKQDTVTASFALVQPGIADAPKVIEALARACGDTHPPTVDQLTERQKARGGGGRPDGLMRREGAASASPAGATDPPARESGEPFPGAVPSDAMLQGLLRRFIRPTNDVASVDAVLKEVKAHIGEDAALRRQAIDGWTRVLHFGDRYGTEYSRKVGQDFLEELKGATE